jgi:alpha-glucosidase (family GH31 glycosyl hydrolase)
MHKPKTNPKKNLSHLYNLCRWASLGAFYPFSRNHYAYFTRSHEYYQWPDVAAAAKKAYTLRYQLLSYMYGAFFLAHVKGGTVARPLLFTDPSDVDAR